MSPRPFSEVASPLGLDATMAADVRSTMTPGAWASLRAADTLGATVHVPHRSAPPPSAAAGPPHLPPISIRLPFTERPPALDGGAPQEDLVVRSLLAEGGMGRLYVAEQRSLSREVVVKTVRDRHDQAQAQALVAEGTITGALEHPNITPVHLAGRDEGGAPLLVMKRIVGVSWSALIEGDEEAWARCPGLSRDRARAHLEILLQVSSAIHFAHEHAVLHRDIKPDNVMVGTLGDVYVVDWGVAMRQQPGISTVAEVVGTPCYVAPEMLVGGPLGPHTDVYLLGATLHVVLTGEVRHQGDTLHEVLEAAWRSEPFDYGDAVPAELASLANAATAHDPALRPASALAFRRALADHLEHLQSLRLASEGWTRTDQLRALRGAGGAQAGARSRLITEARFAFHSALASWPENPRARSGERAVLLEALELELDREGLEAARDLARELGEVPEAPRARLEALEGLVDKRQRDAARLQRIEHDTDVDLAAAERNRLLLGLTMLSLTGGLALLAAGGIGEGGFEPRSAGTMVTLAAGLLALEVLGVLVFRRKLLQNRLNRQLTTLLIGSTSVLLVHRVLDWWRQVDPSTTLRTDLLILSLPCFVTATFVRPRAALGGLALAAAAGAAAWYPQHSVWWFNAGTVLALLALSWALRGAQGVSGARGTPAGPP